MRVLSPKKIPTPSPTEIPSPNPTKKSLGQSLKTPTRVNSPGALSNSAPELTRFNSTPRLPSATQRKSDGSTNEKGGAGAAQVGQKGTVDRISADSNEKESAKVATERAKDLDSLICKYRNGVDSPFFKRVPIPADYDRDSIDVIDELLEDNYRGQAETFSTISRRSVSQQRKELNANRTPSGRAITKPYSPAPYPLPADSSLIVKRQHRQQDPPTRGEPGFFYFNDEENIAIEEVNTKQYSCGKHEHCTDCRETEYSYLENKAMPTSMPPEKRQKVINNTRSIRNIMNVSSDSPNSPPSKLTSIQELENLAKAGAVSNDVFDQIMRVLPVPSAYSAPAPPSSKPAIARATALYRYAKPEDCNFEIGDTIAVYGHIDTDWWLGKNVHTGKEGVFPVTYVQVQANPPPASTYGDGKKNGYPCMA
jgi:hypothetical protein